VLPGHRFSRDQAARLLGVSATADEATVRRAFRLWAAWAHPDHGGDARQFQALCDARDELLTSATPVDVIVVRPRKPWVLAMPTGARIMALVLTAALSALSILVGLVVAMPWGVVPAAVASALWCVAVSRAVLRDGDHGHVIVARSVAWSLVTAAQLVIAGVTGVPVVEVLPVLALPFVVVIAMVNPAAGLWRAPRVNVR